MATTSVQLWHGGDAVALPATAKDSTSIVNFAVQLNKREKQQIVRAFSDESYEMALSFVWQKTMGALKRELASVGLKFLGELLGKSELDEGGNPVTSISDEEAIMLAEELGVITGTEALRMRHANELLRHFIDGDSNDSADEEERMEESEAITTLKACVKNVLGKNRIEVATKFAEFRNALETTVFKEMDDEIQQLLISPYFFRKITITILLQSFRDKSTAKRENSLANLNVILNLLWATLREAERWLVGRAYATAHNDGEATVAAGIKRALMKVKGFDYVPENLRSNIFIRAAEKVVQAHEGIDNFYNEPAPLRELASLGTVIPTPAFGACAGAAMYCYLGNAHGYSYAAADIAADMFSKFSSDRWTYYLSECLPGDSRMLDKLIYERPRKRFADLVVSHGLDQLNVSGRAKKLVENAATKDARKIYTALEGLRADYYGKEK